MLLIVGGSKDHNCNRMAETARSNGVAYRQYFTDIDIPAVSWEFDENILRINGEAFYPSETMLFTRYDVFSVREPNAHPNQQIRNSNWYSTIKGWALANPEVAVLNRGNENMEVSKPRVLGRAKELGFDVPKSWITNDFNAFASKDNYIAKPVSGGAHTVLLSDLVREHGEKTPSPYIIQEKMIYPEMRLFRAGSEYFGISINNETLDSREGKNLKMEEVDVPEHIIKAMKRLTNELGLDYSAADLKTCPETGKLMFLEINTMPMMTGYDNVLNGYLSLAIIDVLEEMVAGNSPHAVRNHSLDTYISP